MAGVSIFPDIVIAGLVEQSTALFWEMLLMGHAV